MRLSEQLKQDDECGDFGKCLKGYPERAKRLENCLFELFVKDAMSWGSSAENARNYANKRLDKLS